MQGVHKGILIYHVPDAMNMRGEYGNILYCVKLLRTAGDGISRDIAVGSTRLSSHGKGYDVNPVCIFKEKEIGLLPIPWQPVSPFQ